MSNSSRNLFTVLILLLQVFASSQNEAKKWYFGYGTGLDFTSTQPSTLSVSSMSTQEGCASIADASGSLLMYTDGTTLWNRTHAVMANGNGLLGSVLSSQSSIILQKPGSSNLYYVITNVGNNIANVPNVNYSIVDMNLAAGNGSVITKNAVLNSDQNTEVLTATRHCNGVDWWIVTHIRNSNTFIAALLSSTGISPGLVFSSTGPSILSGFSQLKISPNGKKIALNFNGAVYLGNFNSANGQVSGVSTIQTSSSGYGCEFSPDGSKLYTTAFNGVLQYDLCQTSALAVASTSIFVHSQIASYGSMQLAPNGKIYLTYNTFTANCNVINNPNVYGAGCNFATASHTFSPKIIHAGLPNFPGSLFFQKPVQSPYFYQVSPSFGCYGAYFNAVLLANSCAAISNSLAMLVWDFDDPLSGANNLSYITNPIHNFSGNGTYNVKLILLYACGFAGDTISQLITINDNCLTYISSSITCASLGSSTITSAVGVGPFTYTWLPGNQTGVIANSLTPGNHTVVVRDVISNYTYSVPITLPSLSAYTGSIAATGSVTCFDGNDGSGLVTNVAGGSGTQTYAWVNGTFVTMAQNPINLFAGTWSVTVTDALTSCQINSVITILQPPALSLTPIASPTACNGASVVLTASNAGGTPILATGYMYTWTNAPPSATAVVSETVLGVHVYTVTSKDAQNCTSSATIAVNYIANPPVAISNVSICPLTYGTLNANGASTYTWFTSGASTSVGASYVDNPSSTSQYTVVGSAQGCTASATGSIILHALPVPTLQSSSPGCEGGGVSFNVSGGTVYQWSGPNQFQSSDAGNVLTNLSLNQAGIYTATVASAFGCTVAASLSIAIQPTPAVTAIGATVCTTQTINLFANSAPGASYIWQGPLGYFSAVQNPTIINPNTARSGTYVVYATSAAGCTNVAYATVVVVPPPSVNVFLSDTSFCAQGFNGSSNTITALAVGANTYTLNTPLSLFSVQSNQSFTVFAQPPFPSLPTVATASLQGSNGVCSTTHPFTVTILPNPVVTVLSSTTAICAGNNFTYNCTGASAYTWASNGINYSTNSNGSTIVTQPTSTATYSVYGRSLGCNSATQVNTITVFPLPTLTLAAAAASICLNDKTVLTARGSGQSFLWTPNVGLSSSAGGSVIAQPLTTQAYTVIATANSCTRTASLVVSVLPLPTASIISKKTKVCLNDSIFLSGTGGIVYEWLGPNNYGLSGKDVVFVANTLQFNDNYKLTVKDLNGCTNSTFTSIEVVPLPNGSLLDYEKDNCVPYCNTFQFTGYNSKTIQSTWMINAISYAGNNFKVCLAEPGSYTITGFLQDAVTGCKSRSNYDLYLHEKPQANFTFGPLQPIERVDEVQFTNSSIGENVIRYRWYFEDITNGSARTSDASHIYEEAGTYAAALVVENSFGCKDTAVKQVKVSPDFAMYVPNTFTPNDDTFNDVFLPIVRAAKNYDLKVYDRWGHEHFHSKSPSDGWDGTHAGEQSKQDVYTWVLEVTASTGEKYSKTGTVTLLR